MVTLAKGKDTFCKKVLIVIGTRPEAIKMAPLYNLLKTDNRFNVKLCVSGQHREMLDQALNLFEIVPDYDLKIGQDNKPLTAIVAATISKLSVILDKFVPKIVLVHGDTATTTAAALAVFYKRIKIGHVEAGLRTWNLNSPWPEEGNRKLTDAVSTVYFAPTRQAEKNLLKENVNPNDIFITGNTVIDALIWTKKKLDNDDRLQNDMRKKFSFLDNSKKLILVTAHRRENFGEGINNICEALVEIAKRKDVQVVYPVHLNPNIEEPVRKKLENHEGIYLLPPQEYLEFLYLMNLSFMILTDSGGIQEEAPTLGKPVLVMRDTTERPEAQIAGTIKLIGTDIGSIKNEVTKLLEDSFAYKKMSGASNPFGDGTASRKIVAVLENLEI